MCGRYVSKEQRVLERELQFLDIKHWPEWAGSYNIAPTQLVPVVIATAQGYVCKLMRYGLIPFFSHGIAPRFSTINARVENLLTHNTWRGPRHRRQRALVIAGAFVEWHVLSDGKRKQPYLIRPADQDTFAMAGLWDTSKSEDGAVTHSFAIVTLPASPLMAAIHNAKKREPAILERGDCVTWLSGSADEAHSVLRQYPDDRLLAYPISTRINDPKNNDSALMEQDGSAAPIAALTPTAELTSHA